MPRDATGHETQAFDCGTIIPTLPNTILYDHIYPLLCKGREDETLLITSVNIGKFVSLGKWLHLLTSFGVFYRLTRLMLEPLIGLMSRT
jgi:hypothetical protein